MPSLDRRAFTRALGSAAVVGTAGCLGGVLGTSRVPADDWPTYGYDAANTGHHPDTSGPSGPLEQQWQLGGRSLRSPVVADGTVYGSTGERSIAAIEAGSGSVRWEYETARSTGGAVGAATEDAIFVRDESGTLAALDPVSGDELWTSNHGSGGDGSPVVVDDVVYVGSSGAVDAVDAEGGDLRWEFGELGDPTPPVVHDGTTYLGLGGSVVALDATTGDELWRTSVAEEHGLAATPTVADGHVYFGTQDKRVVAVDAADGEHRWTTDRHGAMQAGGFAYADGQLYVTTYARLLTLDPESGDVVERADHGSYEYGPPVVVDGTVYYAASSEGLVASDAASGHTEVVFETSTIEGFTPARPVAVDGVVVHGDRTGLYALVEQ